MIDINKIKKLLVLPNKIQIELSKSKNIYIFVKSQQDNIHIKILENIQQKNWIFPIRYHGLIYMNIQRIINNYESCGQLCQYTSPCEQASQQEIEKMFNILENINIDYDEEIVSYIVLFVSTKVFDPKNIWVNKNNQNFIDVLKNNTSLSSKECYAYLSFHYPEMVL